MDDRAALLGEPSTPRRRAFGKDISRAAVIAAGLAAALIALGASRDKFSKGVESKLGRAGRGAVDVASREHVALTARVHGHAFTPKAAHRVVVMTVSTGENAPQLNEWAASLADVGVNKFAIGCADDRCLAPLRALDAPVFSVKETAERYASVGEEDAARWAAFETALELVDADYAVMMCAPTLRFRRNPMEMVADSISRHGGRGAVFAMRGVHAGALNVTKTELSAWTDGKSLASIRDDFLIFTPGSQPLLRAVLAQFKAPVMEDSAKESDEMNWRLDPAFALNHVLSKDMGMRWRAPGGALADAAPFRTKPHEMTIEAALLGENEKVPGLTSELSGAARFANDVLNVVLLDTVVARAHCNDADDDAMPKTFVVGCDLDDASLAGRRVEIDHQCVVLKGLESAGLGVPGGGARPARAFGIFEHVGESPIEDSRGFLGALRACRL